MEETIWNGVIFIPYLKIFIPSSVKIFIPCCLVLRAGSTSLRKEYPPNRFRVEGSILLVKDDRILHPGNDLIALRDRFLNELIGTSKGECPSYIETLQWLEYNVQKSKNTVSERMKR
jgi:hypothetical protein